MMILCECVVLILCTILCLILLVTAFWNFAISLSLLFTTLIVCHCVSCLAMSEQVVVIEQVRRGVDECVS